MSRSIAPVAKAARSHGSAFEPVAIHRATGVTTQPPSRFEHNQPVSQPRGVLPPPPLASGPGLGSRSSTVIPARLAASPSLPSAGASSGPSTGIQKRRSSAIGAMRLIDYVHGGFEEAR